MGRIGTPQLVLKFLANQELFVESMKKIFVIFLTHFYFSLICMDQVTNQSNAQLVPNCFDWLPTEIIRNHIFKKNINENCSLLDDDIKAEKKKFTTLRMVDKKFYEIANSLFEDLFVRTIKKLSPRDLAFDLSIAAKKGHYFRAKIYLKLGASIHNEYEKNNEYYDSFLEACAYGQLQIVQLFLLHNADIHTKGGIALSKAASGGNVEIVKLLLTLGMPVDSGSSFLQPLYYACSSNHIEVAKLLIAHGAEANQCILETVAGRNDKELMQLLLTDEKVPMRTGRCSFHPIIEAAKNGHVEMVKLLSEKYIAIAEKNSKKRKRTDT